MNSKIIKNYIYEGLGFPVKLEKVEFLQVGDEWHPKINVLIIAEKVISELAFQEARLTGNQVKFIRSFFSMSLREFADKVVHESHMAVSKWEKKGNLPTNMNANTEHELRLYILENSLKNKTAKFYELYLKTRRFFSVQQVSDNMIFIAA